MKKRILITLFAALLFSFSISAQILKGHVYDATTNEPLAGASVTYKLKDTQGVVTDINGAYLRKTARVNSAGCECNQLDYSILLL